MDKLFCPDFSHSIVFFLHLPSTSLSCKIKCMYLGLDLVHGEKRKLLPAFSEPDDLPQQRNSLYTTPKLRLSIMTRWLADTKGVTHSGTVLANSCRQQPLPEETAA